MSRLMPPHCSDDITSTGERHIFELLRDDPKTANWVCLHSLGLARHQRRLYGEIDFVVMVPGEGIFCLEVKSGRISRTEGVWTYTNRYGEHTTSTIGPFRQAQEGMFSLMEAVHRRFGKRHRLSRLAFGYGVMFPHISFQQNDPEHEPWQVYDKDSSRQPVSLFIQLLADKTHEKLKRERWYDPKASRPTNADISELVGFLRGDFERVINPADLMVQDEVKLLRLTEEQYRCLDGLQDNDRCLFQGGAGTGKTLLALEFARREGYVGKRVLLICFNKLLGRWIASEIASSAPRVPIVADNFHHLLDDIISKSSRKSEFLRMKSTEQQETLFKEIYPLFALDAVGEGVFEQFDFLIVDEGQDLLRSEYLDVLDSLLKDGLMNGRWAIFCDFHRQAIYADVTPEEMIAELDRRALHYARFLLTTNCRNTRHIGEETALVSGFDAPVFLPSSVEGVPVEYRFYTDAKRQREKIRGIIKTLLSEDIPAERISILSIYTRQRSCLAEPLQGIRCAIEDLGELNITNNQQGTIYFSTIHAFKGLENSVIIIADIEHLADELSRALLYVGMSRARLRLFVLVAESAREEYQTIVRKKIREGVIVT